MSSSPSRYPSRYIPLPFWSVMVLPLMVIPLIALVVDAVISIAASVPAGLEPPPLVKVLLLIVPLVKAVLAALVEVSIIPRLYM